VDAIVEKARGCNGLPCERDSVLVSAGATGALGAAIGAIASPGDEVLILAPHWPLIRGIVSAFRATPVEVPFYDRVSSPGEALDAVSAALGSRSVALYVSTPSNPTGRVLPQGWLEMLAEWAASEGLWLLADEVYEDYVYRGEHVSIGRFAPERTLSVFSFSKAYGMAGNRTGYLVGPPEAISQALKISTHTWYSAPTCGQFAGLRALRDGAGWVERARQSYREVGDATAALLGLPPPEGSMFHFVNVRQKLDAGARREFRRGVRRLGAPLLHVGTAVAGARRRGPPGAPPHLMGSQRRPARPQSRQRAVSRADPRVQSGSSCAGRRSSCAM
jgi:N-succinyldiaminopimelate aminotransferase